MSDVKCSVDTLRTAKRMSARNAMVVLITAPQTFSMRRRLLEIPRICVLFQFLQRRDSPDIPAMTFHKRIGIHECLHALGSKLMLKYQQSGRLWAGDERTDRLIDRRHGVGKILAWKSPITRVVAPKNGGKTKYALRYKAYTKIEISKRRSMQESESSGWHGGRQKV
jgi:hypothetical protein